MARDILEGALYAFIIGGVLFFKGWSKMRKRRAIEETPTSTIRSVAMGFVEIKGAATQGIELFTAPFSRKKCVYYKFLVQEYRRSKNSGYWATIKSGGASSEFRVKDETGEIAVSPIGAQIDLPETFRQKKLTEEMKASLEELGVSYKGFLGIRRNLRFIEYAITPKDSLYILGTAKTKQDVQGIKNEDRVVIGKSGKNIFYISNKSEKELLKNFGRGTWLSLFGGAALLVAGVVIVIIRFNI